MSEDQPQACVRCLHLQQKLAEAAKELAGRQREHDRELRDAARAENAQLREEVRVLRHNVWRALKPLREAKLHSAVHLVVECVNEAIKCLEDPAYS